MKSKLIPFDINQPDGFYHMWIEVEDGKPVIKVSLTMNDTGEWRKIRAMATSDKIYNHTLIYRDFIIYQVRKLNNTSHKKSN